MAACQAGGKHQAVADPFRVSLSFVAKLLGRHRPSGSAAAWPPGRGPAARLASPALAQLSACLRQTPDATLAELRVWLAAVGGPARRQSALGRAVQTLDWRRKKRSLHAAERDPERVKALRQAVVEAVQEEEVTCFKFVDETSPNLTSCRRYARAEAGQRVGHGVPLPGGPNGTLVAALTPTGLPAAMSVGGAVNGESFAA